MDRLDSINEIKANLKAQLERDEPLDLKKLCDLMDMRLRHQFDV